MVDQSQLWKRDLMEAELLMRLLQKYYPNSSYFSGFFVIFQSRTCAMLRNMLYLLRH